MIPQVKGAVITIYRNKPALDVTESYKPNHIPILMRREDIKPFRFNAEAAACGELPRGILLKLCLNLFPLKMLLVTCRI
ncbi:hypothetical protein [Gloeocapsa sp. PCC 73106]|uniref:hypothetical protein n=1 Tax=Gloeocapsa sp. PCC 73106 TaxID=102232 RepID=UPI0002AC37D7|nr:hypothetical protein [Gloeocapsa sp. PCC 73106]ELR97604.1 hypothetical protein GLO73106DRAFT_00014150 [Gloeocapsa sp. PCC 73106]